jgi:hypothetical protein
MKKLTFVRRESMIMKKAVLLTMLAIMAFSTVNAREASTLFGTKWKLEGFFDAETRELRQPVSGDSAQDIDQENLFTLEFSQDSIVRHDGREYQTCKGRLAYSEFWGLYAADYLNSRMGFDVLIRPSKMGDPEDGEKYDRALYLSRKFELKGNNLKIYYGDGADYLLFKPLVQVRTPNTESAISQTDHNQAEAVTSPGIVLSRERVAAGPNPVAKSAGLINFYRVGKQVKNSSLKIYNDTGRAIGKINITDRGHTGNGQSQSERQVGSWSLKDAKGRPVSEGTYLVKGTLKTVDRKSEKIALLIRVQ